MTKHQIKISYTKIFEDDQFQVISIKNSTAYLPKQILDKSDVDGLCRSPIWDVTLVPYMEH